MKSFIENKYIFISLFVVSVLWIIFNLIILTRSPTVWMDEVAYSDPAVNLYLFGNFFSSAWRSIPPDKFWSGNVPGYQFLLYLWFSFTGFSLETTRLFPLIITLFSGLFFTYSLNEAKLIKSKVILVGFFITFLYSGSVSYAYKQVRPDIICILLLALLFRVMTLKVNNSNDIPPQKKILFIAGCITPLFGLQFLPFFTLLFLCNYFLFGKVKDIYFGLFYITGALVGLFLLVVLYYANGSLEYFIASITPHVKILNSQVISEDIFNINSPSSWLELFSKDIGSIILLSMILTVYTIRKYTYQHVAVEKKLLTAALLVFIFIPFGMAGLGMYRPYYTFMVGIPLIIIAAIYIDLLILTSAPHKLIRLASLFFLIILLTGFPARFILSINEWEERDYSIVTRFVLKNVNETDIAFINWQAYYPAKIKAKKILFHYDISNHSDISKVSVLIVEKDFFKKNSAFNESQWIEIDSLGLLRPQNKKYYFISVANKYELTAYRRRF